jgi:hypothetical protein
MASKLIVNNIESLDTGRSIEVDNIADQATTYTETEVDGLLDAKANISGQIFTGEINFRGAGGNTTNSGYGENVLQNNTTGNSNTANGTSALQNNTEGSGNTANGRTALVSNTGGNENTANGTDALYNNTEGSENTANGKSALYNNTDGSENTANGKSVLYNNTEGKENTANGTDALPNNTTGSDNTACGYNTGGGIYTGSGNSIFGANVTRLEHDLTDNLILASGGVIRLQHDGVGTTTVQGDLVADNLYTETEVDDLIATRSVCPSDTAITGTATFTNSTNNIALTGIGSIGLEVGDVVQVTGTASNNKLFTVEVITDSGNVIVNSAHAGGTTSKSLVNETVSATVTLLSKWVNAPVGLGEGWVSLMAGRAKDIIYTNNTGRSLSVMVSVADVTFDDSNITAYVDDLQLSVSEDNPYSDSASASRATVSFLVPNESTYEINFLTDSDKLNTWVELR